MENERYAATAETISVIVPVYKVEAYLRACIDSILAQTHRDFQLILVDDGSPDRCGEICDEYAAKDNRIVVIHQENGGISAARNAGLDWVFANSESQWLSFVDSDDMISTVCLRTLYEYALESGADIVVTGGETFTNETELESAPQNIVSVRTVTGREACYEILGDNNFFLNFAWGKLFHRKLFETTRFELGKIYEDEALMTKMLYRTPKVTILRSWLYYYRQREGSILHSGFTIQRFDHVVLIDDYIAFFESVNERELARLSGKRRRILAAKYTVIAWKAKMLDQVPKGCRMSVCGAILVTLWQTLSRGGVKFAVERLGNLKSRHLGK